MHVALLHRMAIVAVLVSCESIAYPSEVHRICSRHTVCGGLVASLFPMHTFE
jgi:hypothetical protein